MSAETRQTWKSVAMAILAALALAKLPGRLGPRATFALAPVVVAGVVLFDDAKQLLDKSCSVIPVRPGEKVPAVTWDEFTRRLPTLAEVTTWWGSAAKAAYNVGLVCGQVSGLAVIDADSREAAVALYRRLPKTRLMSKTPRGVHFFYRLAAGQILSPRVRAVVMGVVCDLRLERSFVVVPPSLHPSGARYEWVYPPAEVDFDRLPCFEEAWVQEQVPTRVSSANRTIRNARAYIARLFAVSGRRGHDTTYRCACVLRDAGLSEAEALAALVEWNQTNCLDQGGRAYPWSVKELLHKVHDAFHQGTSHGHRHR